MWRQGETRVLTATRAELRVSAGTWAFAERRKAEIADHWAMRCRETPGFFNGPVHLLSTFSIDSQGLLSARFVRSDFASFLYWRETGWQDDTVMDCFGSALIFSAEGSLLLGQQRRGNLNSGLLYPPSGFIDPCDITPDGHIDIDASALREVGEETGLDGALLAPLGGYTLTMAGPVLSIGVPVRCPLADADLAAHVAGHIGADPASELLRAVLVRPGEALSGHPMPEYTRALLDHLAGVKNSA